MRDPSTLNSSWGFHTRLLPLHFPSALPALSHRYLLRSLRFPSGSRDATSCCFTRVVRDIFSNSYVLASLHLQTAFRLMIRRWYCWSCLKCLARQLRYHIHIVSGIQRCPHLEMSEYLNVECSNKKDCRRQVLSPDNPRETLLCTPLSPGQSWDVPRGDCTY